MFFMMVDRVIECIVCAQHDHHGNRPNNVGPGLWSHGPGPPGGRAGAGEADEVHDEDAGIPQAGVTEEEEAIRADSQKLATPMS